MPWDYKLWDVHHIFTISILSVVFNFKGRRVLGIVLACLSNQHQPTKVLKCECLTAFDYLKSLEQSEQGVHDCEYQVTVLLTSDTAEDDGPGLDVYTYVQALPFVEATASWWYRKT